MLAAYNEPNLNAGRLHQELIPDSRPFVKTSTSRTRKSRLSQRAPTRPNSRGVTASGLNRQIDTLRFTVDSRHVEIHAQYTPVRVGRITQVHHQDRSSRRNSIWKSRFRHDHDTILASGNRNISPLLGLLTCGDIKSSIFIDIIWSLASVRDILQ